MGTLGRSWLGRVRREMPTMCRICYLWLRLMGSFMGTGCMIIRMKLVPGLPCRISLTS
ncbi:hypothetical protein BDV23DRAFT_143346 [Aspergillus alliaceus]|uniref:Uncharacterized protein n=1 Tax=Petromyces alliaceus TaxID=209559 RepID=A0A5N7CSY2_PETAA|nr:hypothetical protein BDV23DRAFT_143346 [Aspergillus alliaceus]